LLDIRLADHHARRPRYPDQSTGAYLDSRKPDRPQAVGARPGTDREIYSLVVTGDGEKFFSAGADLKLFAGGDKATAREMARHFGEAFEALAGFRGLTIAAINGYAMGGGLECALACDLRIAEEHAQMALPEAGVGLLPCAGGTQWLSWLVGEGSAKRMVLCGHQRRLM
jgi:enoyl-CoA hydratase/carnithine racemase